MANYFSSTKNNKNLSMFVDNARFLYLKLCEGEDLGYESFCNRFKSHFTNGIKIGKNSFVKVFRKELDRNPDGETYDLTVWNTNQGVSDNQRMVIKVISLLNTFLEKPYIGADEQMFEAFTAKRFTDEEHPMLKGIGNSNPFRRFFHRFYVYLPYYAMQGPCRGLFHVFENETTGKVQATLLIAHCIEDDEIFTDENAKAVIDVKDADSAKKLFAERFKSDNVTSPYQLYTANDNNVQMSTKMLSFDLKRYEGDDGIITLKLCVEKAFKSSNFYQGGQGVSFRVHENNGKIYCSWVFLVNMLTGDTKKEALPIPATVIQEYIQNNPIQAGQNCLPYSEGHNTRFFDFLRNQKRQEIQQGDENEKTELEKKEILKSLIKSNEGIDLLIEMLQEMKS